ncbi:MAG: NUDIX domain-containing protein [Clostridiales bacterium]|nr:NUDIX domain-containing protein [Clostridiales bacterium]
MEFDKNDCCFVRDGNRFRYRAGAIIVENGCLLLVTNDASDYYYSVGGGVHIGETSADAVVREVKEETGVDYEIDRLAVVHENFFCTDSGVNKGLIRHELSLFYLMKPRGTQEIHSDSYCPDGKEFLEWVPFNKLDKVRFYPEFLREFLKDGKLCMPDGVVRKVTNDL